MKKLATAAALGAALGAQPALATNDDIIKVRAAGNVQVTMDALEAAVQGPGPRCLPASTMVPGRKAWGRIWRRRSF